MEDFDYEKMARALIKAQKEQENNDDKEDLSLFIKTISYFLFNAFFIITTYRFFNKINEFIIIDSLFGTFLGGIIKSLLIIFSAIFIYVILYKTGKELLYTNDRSFQLNFITVLLALITALLD